MGEHVFFFFFKKNKSYISGSLRERYLACYPGSGSKWLLRVLMGSTGLHCFGCRTSDYIPGASFLVKTHHQNPGQIF